MSGQFYMYRSSLEALPLALGHSGSRSSCTSQRCSDRQPRCRFGAVVAAVNCETGQEVAIKLALKQAKQTSAQLREVVLQACLQHEYIVPILDIVYDPIVPPLRGARAGALKAGAWLVQSVFCSAARHGKNESMAVISACVCCKQEGRPSWASLWKRLRAANSSTR